MCNKLVVGVASDEDIRINKGPSILNCEERCEILKHCKFVDEIIADVIFTPTLETLKDANCNYYAHGDDPCIDAYGVDVT
jgi:glycerol-3-phosphate cytidylyltransferase-like family protein